MKTENTTRHNVIPCPCCGYKMDAATPISEEKGGRPGPEAGSIALCLKCGQILEYTVAAGQLTLAVCPPAVLKELKKHQPEDFARLNRAARMIKLTRPTN